MNNENVIKSFFVGIVIGTVLQLLGDGSTADRVLGILASGAIGLLVGLVTEWLTSLLPIRIARARTYFFINNLIALVVTGVLLLALAPLAADQLDSAAAWWPVVAVVVVIVCAANLVDYLLYRRDQSRLRALQASLDQSGD